MRNFFNNIKDFFIQNKKCLFNCISFVLYCIALAFLFLLTVNLNIVTKTNDNILSIDEIIKLDGDFDCILVLGAGVKKDGSPTDMLYDRLYAANEAFVNGKSNLLLLSGDSEKSTYTETKTMKNVLNGFGVDDDNIICDGYGLSTYESIWRAKNVYGYDKMLIVSQGYHLPRALHIADEMGVSAYGLDGALREYGKQPIYSLREYLARLKDMIYAEICPEPIYTEIWGNIDE